MFYVVVVHPHIPGVDGLDEDAMNAYVAMNPDGDIEVTAERILTSNDASQEEAEFVGQMLANETAHPVAVYDDSNVPAEIREQVAKGNSEPVGNDLNVMLLKQTILGSNVPQSDLLN
jgi:hypothetical protein